MKKYSKEEAIKIVTEAAKAYEKNLCGKCFLLCYEINGENHFTEVGFQAHHFGHFTGLYRNNCSSKEFYCRALSGRLSKLDFEFDLHGNAHRKLAVLPMLPNIFSTPLLYGAFNNSGLYISADYFIGRTKAMISVGFRHDQPFDIPVSLYCEDIRKLSSKAVSILVVWEREYGEKQYTYPRYCKDSVDAQELLSEYMCASQTKG